MRANHFDGFVFSSKAAVAAVVAVVAFDLFSLPGAVWAAVSAVIVTQPNLHPSIKASLTRVIANLIGAFTGAALSTVLGHTLLCLGIGVLLTGLVCHFAHLDDAFRPAYAAVVIVTLASETSTWIGSLDRVLAVSIGCVCALAVGFACDRITRGFGPSRKDDTANDEPSE